MQVQLAATLIQPDGIPVAEMSAPCQCQGSRANLQCRTIVIQPLIGRHRDRGRGAVGPISGENGTLRNGQLTAAEVEVSGNGASLGHKLSAAQERESTVKPKVATPAAQCSSFAHHCRISHRQGRVVGTQAQIRAIEQSQNSSVHVLVAGERQHRIHREFIQQQSVGRVHRKVVAEVQVTHGISFSSDLQALACVTWRICSQARKGGAATQHQQTGRTAQCQVVGIVKHSPTGKGQRVRLQIQPLPQMGQRLACGNFHRGLSQRFQRSRSGQGFVNRQASSSQGHVRRQCSCVWQLERSPGRNRDFPRKGRSGGNGKRGKIVDGKLIHR